MRLLFTLISFCCISLIFAQDKSSFKRNLISMGEITKRDTMKVDFKYTNNTNGIIVIVNTTSNCDCTWLEYPKSPIKPNESVSLTAVYYAKDKGAFAKDIYVILSNGKRHKISIVGQVITK